MMVNLDSVLKTYKKALKVLLLIKVQELLDLILEEIFDKLNNIKLYCNSFSLYVLK